MRIVTFQAATPDSALKRANKIGKTGEYSEGKPDGEIAFEFVGVMELKDISTGYQDGEVWSEIIEMIEPMERQQNIIPDESELDVMRKVAPIVRGRLKFDWAKREI